MHRTLRLHPDCRRQPVVRVDVDIDWQPGRILALKYVTDGMPKLPPPVADETTGCRADDLWKHTCFEAFIRRPADEAYCEFNFAPDRRWAAYEFDGYRRSRRDLSTSAPEIEVCVADDGFVLLARLQLEAAAGIWQMGLSAVTEDETGHLSYWALNHPPGKPDFHHTAGFALEFSP